MPIPKSKKSKSKSETKPTSEIGLRHGSDNWWDNLAALSRLVTSFLWFFSCREGTSLISHKVAASFLADTDTSFPLPPPPLEAGSLGNSAFSIANEGDLDLDLALVFHVGTCVLDPPRFPTRIARLNRYLRTNEDDDDDEQPRFLILHTLPVFPSKLWFCQDIIGQKTKKKTKSYENVHRESWRPNCGIFKIFKIWAATKSFMEGTLMLIPFMFGKFGAVGLEFSKEKWLSKILPLEHSAVFKRSDDLLTSVKNGMWTRIWLQWRNFCFVSEILRGKTQWKAECDGKRERDGWGRMRVSEAFFSSIYVQRCWVGFKRR